MARPRKGQDRLLRKGAEARNRGLDPAANRGGDGRGTRPPYKADNLLELLDLILHKNPDLLAALARQADWPMCAPCPARVPKLNGCGESNLKEGNANYEKGRRGLMAKLAQLR